MIPVAMSRYFFIIFACLLAIGGWMLSHQRSGEYPMTYWFNNMREQSKIRDQEMNGETASMKGIMPVPAGTVALDFDAAPVHDSILLVYPQAGSSYLTTGKTHGSFGNVLPAELGGMVRYGDILKTGETVYTVHCRVCHGAGMTGNGAMSAYPEYPVMPSLLDEKFVRYPLGQLFHSIAWGQGNMPAFGNKLTAREIWSVGACLKYRQEEGKKDS